MTSRTFALIVSCLIAVSSLSAAQTSHAFLWTQSTGMRDLGTISGWPDSGATGINASGQVVGYDYQLTGAAATFRWTQSAGQHRLTPIGTVTNEAFGINAAGAVVGIYYATDGSEHAYFWSQATGVQDLGTLGGNNNTYPRAINSSGQVVGQSGTNSGSVDAFLWTESTGIQDLGGLPGGIGSVAYAINDTGQIAGQALAADGIGLATIWLNGKVMQIGKLGNCTSLNCSYALGINSAGQVVGASLTTRGTMHAFALNPIRGR